MAESPVVGKVSWRHYCESLIYSRDLQFSLDVSRVRTPPHYMAEMLPSLQLAVEAMRNLEAGAIANPDEQRMVGHYWLRTPSLAPTPELQQQITDTLDAVKRFAYGVTNGQLQGKSGPFRNMIVVGIGGSALGPQFVTHALTTANAPVRAYFLDNTDPDGFDRVLGALANSLDRTLVIVISKSGGTPETRNGMIEVQHAYREANLDFGSHAVAITQVGSKLDQTAQREGWLARFPMEDWVGGRTSIMSAVGLLPMAIQGMDIGIFLRGAADMDAWTRSLDVERNPACVLAAMWYHLTGGRGNKDMVILPYKDRLELFSKYLQQLVMESLGKRHDRSGAEVFQGLAVYGNKGSTDQHAYVQQLRDGVPNFFATFIKVLKDRAGDSPEVDPGITAGDYLQGFLLGTRTALYESARDSITLSISDVNEHSVGMLIALYERAVGLYAELVNINAYHQPGVEAGKKAAAAVLELQSSAVDQLRNSGRALSAEEVAIALGRPDDAETIFHVLEHMAANPGRGVSVVIGNTPAEMKFRAGHTLAQRLGSLRPTKTS